MTYSEIISNCVNDINFLIALILWGAFLIGGFSYFGVVWAKWALSAWKDFFQFFRQLLLRLRQRKKDR